MRTSTGWPSVVAVIQYYSGFRSEASLLAFPLALNVAAKAAESKNGAPAFDSATLGSG
jgi:hypothetical protein